MGEATLPVPWTDTVATDRDDRAPLADPTRADLAGLSPTAGR